MHRSQLLFKKICPHPLQNFAVATFHSSQVGFARESEQRMQVNLQWLHFPPLGTMAF
jgi:hypothetical protein